ncbi:MULTISPECIES: DUF72 domain-containing protein [unclassified Terrabacter]|uniref:DUF72 domain-containing protein n=1 Tax=unclassified Terrabacter TaxID=2630222 RepID=UPI0006FA797B|nr:MULTISPECIES: DUF72 domain-containing protein [unclassified Terrabacter]KRB43218.1 hypothetical protein ASD90_20065 [Terrabacter sp. Root181]KRF47101.1 hypothetical protein ASG96_03610 [Terrabacter sp. Soil810]
MPHARIGVSGWRYPSWRGDFYPKGLPQRLELTYAAERMTSIEVNGSFYSLQRPSSYAAWRAAVPADVVLAVKGGRFITHLKSLRDVETPLANFFASGVLALGAQLGPVLWQLPERLAFDRERLARFFELLPRSTSDAARLAAGHDDKLADDRVLTTCDVEAPVRHALEPRHESFESDEARALCAEHGVALVVADSAGRWPVMRDATSDFRYVRLHGESELYASGYTDASLDRWAGTCRDWLDEGHDVHVYFDNDARGHAPHDAVRLVRRLGLSTVA